MRDDGGGLSLVSKAARFKVIGAETIAVGAFLLTTFLLNWSGTNLSRFLPNVDSDLPIVGGALVFIGLEIFSLIKDLPSSVSPPTGQEASRPPSTLGPSEGRLISVSKLVALDMALHGRKLVLLEFGITAPAMIAAGLFVILKSYLPLGLYLVLVGIDYIPLLIYAAMSTGRLGEGVGQNRRDMVGNIRKYGIQQTLILLPFAIPILAILQKSGRPH